jgi:hypothetical protein
MAQATIETTVTGLQGRPVSAAAPATNQILTWNGTTWVPQQLGSARAYAQGQYMPSTWYQTTTDLVEAVGLPHVSGAALIGQLPTITPVVTGIVAVTMQAWSSNGSTPPGIVAGTLYSWNVFFGSGAAPAAGTIIVVPATDFTCSWPGGSGMLLNPSSLGCSAAADGQFFPMEIVGTIRGLTLGTPYWFDVAIQTDIAANPAGINAVTMTLAEV